MSAALLQSLVNDWRKIKEDLWRGDGSEPPIDRLRDITSELLTRLEIQNVLLLTAKLLQSCRSDKQLPNQQATRVKYLVKFAFERTTRGNVSERQLRLRELDCTSLKLCGLSYTVKELVEMSSPLFDFLVAKLPSFVEIHDLSLLLCRDDINKIVRADYAPEDMEKFEAFIVGRWLISRSRSSWH